MQHAWGIAVILRYRYLAINVSTIENNEILHFENVKVLRIWYNYFLDFSMRTRKKLCFFLLVFPMTIITLFRTVTKNIL